MTNFIYNESPDLKEARLRENQHNCSHPSLRCSVCHLYKDEVTSLREANKRVLEGIIRQYEVLLIAQGVLIIPYDDLCQGGIINQAVEKEMQDTKARLQRHSE